MGKARSPPFLGFFLLADNEDMHKISDEFEFQPDRTTDYGVSCPWASKKFPIDLQWENDVSVLACSFFIESSSKLLVTIFCVASLGVGKGCIMFSGRLDQNSGVHGNRKPPLAYNGENGVSTFSWLLLIRSLLYLQVTRTCIKSRTSLNFGQKGPLTMELAALERLKIFPYTYNGKMVSPC